MQPSIKWAQRKEGNVLVTIEVHDAQDPKISLTANSFTFTGASDKGDIKFNTTIELFEEIVVEESHYLVRPRGIEMKLMKKDTSIWWPRLAKTTKKLHYVTVDWNRWVDEDDEEEKKNDFAWDGQGMNFDDDDDDDDSSDDDMVEAQEEKPEADAKEEDKPTEPVEVD
jgi:prostaglandin-E synthase